MNQDILQFFDTHPNALPLYELFEQRLLSEIENVTIKVQKTQISFSNKHNFAFVSFLAVRKAKERPENYIVITFGLGYHAGSPRIDVSEPEEIDDELMGWVKEAAVFSVGKRR